MKKLFRLSLCLALLCSLQAANEINIIGTLTYANASVGIAAQSQALNKTVNITGQNFTALTFSVPTTAGGTAIPVSNLSTIGWIYIRNLDSTNYVTILTSASGTAFARILPGEFMMLRLDTTVTAPAALAHTAAVVIQYLALEI